MVTQYDKPIGPSRPIGYDTEGNPVFPEDIGKPIEKKGDVIYQSPRWFGGGGGSSPVTPTTTPPPSVAAGADIAAQQRAAEQARQEAERLASLQVEAERQKIEEGRIKDITLIEIKRLQSRQIQREAGVFGQDIPEAVALSRIEKYRREQERKAAEQKVTKEIIQPPIPQVTEIGQKPVDLRPWVIPPYIIEKGIDFTFGESGKKYIGIGLPGSPLFISFQEIKTGARSALISGPTLKVLPKVFTPIVQKYPSIPGKVLGELIPTTPGEIAILGATAVTFPALPKIARIGVGTITTTSQIERVFNPSLPPEKRIAAGIIGTAVGAGTVFETIPYIKGGIAKLSPEYKPVKIQEAGFEAVAVAKEPIGLIQLGSPAKTGLTKGVKLPPISPLKRGGFGVKAAEKSLYLGKQTVATSQIGFFEQGKEIKLTREFFTTPQEPFLGIAETRVSRLGLTTLMDVPKTTQIGFGIPKTPQIGIEKGAVVTRTGIGGTYTIGKGTELEATKIGATISGVTKTGVTVIKGQYVELYGFKTGPSAPGGIYTTVSTQPLTRVSGESVFGTAALATQISPVTKPISTVQIISPTTKPISIRPTTKTITTISPITRIKTPPRISIVSITKTPSIKSPPKTPAIKFPTAIISPPKRPSTIPSIPPIRGGYIPFKPKQIKPSGRYVTSIRRFGKWKPISISGTQRKAFSIGAIKAGRTLAASFKVSGPRVRERLPSGFRPSRKEKGVFIERRGLRLSTRPEVGEIQTFKRKKVKGGKK